MKKNGSQFQGFSWVVLMLVGLSGCGERKRSSYKAPLTGMSYTRDEGYAMEIAYDDEASEEHVIHYAFNERDDEQSSDKNISFLSPISLAENDEIDSNDEITEIALNDLQRIFDMAHDEMMLAYDDASYENTLVSYNADSFIESSCADNLFAVHDELAKDQPVEVVMEESCV